MSVFPFVDDPDHDQEPADSNHEEQAQRRPHRQRDWLVRCYLIRAADAFNSAVITYAVPLMVLSLTHSAAWTGLAFLLEWLPRLGAIAGSGPLIDRHGAVRTVFAASTLRAGAAVLTLAGLSLGAGVVAVLAFGVAAGIAAQASFLASESLGNQAGRIAGGQVSRVQSRLTAIDQVAALLGPLVGGALLLAGPALLLAVVAILSAVTITVTLVQPAEQHPDQATTNTEEGALVALAQGFGVLWRRNALLWLVIVIAAVNLAFGVIQIATPIAVTQHLHRSSAAVGLVWAIAAAASLTVVLLARRAVDRLGVYRVALVSALLVAVSTAAAAQTGTLSTFALAVAAVTSAEGAATVAVRTARARLIPTDRYAATLAATLLIQRLPFPLAGLLVAATPARNLPHLLLATAALLTVATAVGATRLASHRSGFEAEQPAALEPAALPESA
ncbi:MFS transporter [Kitasatospora sp. NPDC004669]|uniref:MFS transporter n=1 Tax=Kitasatospora sp. NPDC004669 TaxID=3154555 RepID=UPI0033AFF1DC